MSFQRSNQIWPLLFLTSSIISIGVLIIFISHRAIGHTLPCKQSTGLSCPYALCPNTSATYTCEIPNPQGITQWSFPTGTCINNDDMIIFDQDTQSNCATEVSKCGSFTAANSPPTNGVCTTSTLSVLITNQLNGTVVSCWNIGGAYNGLIGYATITVAAQPQPPIVSAYAGLNNIVLPLRSDGITTYNVTVQGDNALAYIHITNGTDGVVNVLQSNTNYSIIATATKCGWNSIASMLTICTLANPPYDVKIFIDFSANIAVIWTHVGGCVEYYDVQLSTQSGDIVQNDTITCTFTCVYLPSVNVSTNGYVLLVASVTKGTAGPAISVSINKRYTPHNASFNWTNEDEGFMIRNNCSDCCPMRCTAYEDEITVIATLSSLSSFILGAVISIVLCSYFRSKKECRSGCKQEEPNGQPALCARCKIEMDAGTEIPLQENIVYGLSILKPRVSTVTSKF